MTAQRVQITDMTEAMSKNANSVRRVQPTEPLRSNKIGGIRQQQVNGKVELMPLCRHFTEAGQKNSQALAR